MSDKVPVPVRVNTRISYESNKWLEDRALKNAMSKSALINIAIENYIKEIDITQGLPKLMLELEKQGIKLGLEK